MSKTAVIDIGSNSVRLMLWADGKVLYKQLSTTRLGEGTAFSLCLKEEAIERTARAVSAFAERAKREGAENIFAYATEAVRSAENKEVFLARVRQLSGLEVEVLSGETEAKLGLFGALGEHGDGGMIDVGGASTEVSFRKSGKLVFSVSISLGAVRLYDLCHDSIGCLQDSVSPHLEKLSVAPKGLPVYGVGGTATTLASVYLKLERYSSSAVQGCRIKESELGPLTAQLLSLSAEERKQLPGMDARRADIIGGGAFLLTSVLKTLGADELIVSDSDNLEGYLAYKGMQ